MTAVGPTRRVYLTGLSGAGKSAVAQATAARFGWTSVDTDALIVAQTGVAIAELFRTRGEAGFRRIERQVVRAATR
ncbi:MAG: shikimate kinase, partial [Actinobacteria bacterium]|nr:shikimate kinase [Actinomycetota bacterium]